MPLLLFFVIVCAIYDTSSSARTARPLPQFMHHYDLADDWTWLPGCVEGRWYRHAPPRTVLCTLYHDGYARWGEGLAQIPSLANANLDQLAQEDRWSTLRTILADALHNEREHRTAPRAAYLRLRAHCNGLGLLA